VPEREEEEAFDHALNHKTFFHCFLGRSEVIRLSLQTVGRLQM
jgi:hypothetical protein